MTGWSPRQQEPDPYGLLEVDRNASRADVVRAYRLKARSLHPDASQDPDAAARFQELTGAYEMLSDPGRRDAYDQRHPGHAPARPHPPGRVTPSAATPRPATMHPAPASGAPLWAGPVHVQPPGDTANAEPAWPGVGTVPPGPQGIAAALLSDMIRCYFGGDPGWPGDDQDWPL